MWTCKNTEMIEAPMKKLALLFIIPILLSACTTIKDLETSKDLETKKAAGEEELTVFIRGDWETVYDAVIYVFRHSENSFISRLYKLSKIDNAKEDKVIYVSINVTGSAALGIFFKPLNDKKT
jgi:hypothetical protein